MANVTRPKGNMYSLAKLAKERLKNNSYTKTNGTVINNASIFYEYISKQKSKEANLQKENSSTLSKTGKLTYDEELYKKVCRLIENNDTSNPVSNLIDKELFASLDSEAKQFYINNLTQKYKFMKNRYYKEHPISLFM